MHGLRRAPASPGFYGGILCWCSGDTFTVKILVDAKAVGSDVTLTEEDTAQAVFRDLSGFPVATFSGAVCDGVFSLVFDSEKSGLFSPGRYLLDVILCLRGGERVTAVKGSPVRCY